MSQSSFITNTMNMIEHVLNDCNQSQKDCICSIRVRYLKDRPDLPENKRYMTEVFCDEKGTSFHSEISQILDQKRKKIGS